MCIHYAKVKFIPYLLKRIKSSRTKRRGYAYGLNFLSIKYTTPNKIQNNGYDKIKRRK